MITTSRKIFFTSLAFGIPISQNRFLGQPLEIRGRCSGTFNRIQHNPLSKGKENASLRFRKTDLQRHGVANKFPRSPLSLDLQVQK